MNDFISIIGTIASVGSIPLAIYLYIKSSEQKILKIRREIVKTLSYQLGENRHLSSLEIQAVINSKTRENKIKSNSINIEEIIEDLMSETISNPLIENEKRDFFLNNFKSLLSKNELFELIEKIALDSNGTEKIKKENIDKRVFELIEKQKKHREEFEKIIAKKDENFSSLFGLVGAIMSVSVGILTIIGNEKLIGNFDNFLNESNKELFTVIISSLAGIIALTVTFATKKILNNKK